MTYINIVETLDSTIANAVDQLETEGITYGEHLTDEQFDTIQDFIEQLEAIRGVIND